MNINDVYFGKSVFLEVHGEISFLVTSIVQFNIRILSIFKEFFVFVWFEIWDNLHQMQGG